MGKRTTTIADRRINDNRPRATVEDLARYGFVRVGSITLPDPQTFLITIEDPEANDLERVVYAHLVGGTVRRWGSSKGNFRRRIGGWNYDVTSTLKGNPKSTPAWEAVLWRDCLTAHGPGAVYARVGTEVTTPVGTYPAYRDEESVLINRHGHDFGRHGNQ